MRKVFILVLLLGCIAALPAVGQAPPADVVTVGSVTAPAGSTIDVPVYIRDISGTPLGIDQPFGSRIQAYGITVNYSPAAAIQSVTFTRAGITASLTPAFESSPATPGTISLIDTFQESTDLIPFTSNAAAPGNQIGVLHVTLAPSAPVGAVTLALDPTLTQLSNQAGTTKETTTLANLVLVDGAITVTPAVATVPALSPLALAMLAMMLSAAAVVLLRR
jgi:hypothetical protein